MIQQVILNLLRNAAEAMQENAVKGKEPRISLRVAHEQDTSTVRIEVEDNGPGLDEATRRRVFEPFFTTKPTGEGTGLGLSVSYFIITEHHHGQMRVESVPGKGAKFIIKLPVRSST
jgi:signal transduction histidine kinase